MSPDLLEELRSFRQTLRDCKADNLRTMRNYSRNWNGGWSDEMAQFMHGMARGKEGALSRLDKMISMLEISDDTQNV
tara:strand:+ start:980 stop:1210 length:231 start_codon:yes stop_codon:yes gene_type:complete